MHFSVNNLCNPSEIERLQVISYITDALVNYARARGFKADFTQVTFNFNNVEHEIASEGISIYISGLRVSTNLKEQIKIGLERLDFVVHATVETV